MAMERAKRLERDGGNSQPAAAPNMRESVEAPGALCGARGEKLSKQIESACAPSSRIAPDNDAVLRKVIVAWAGLNPNFKAAILAMLRA